MAPASRRKGKPKQTRALKAKTTQRAPSHATSRKPLNMQRDATRKQELQRTARKRSDHASDNPGGLEVVDLMNRRTKAFFELPTRMARCRSPLELWSEQVRFIQDMFGDFQSAAHSLIHAPQLHHAQVTTTEVELPEKS